MQAILLSRKEVARRAKQLYESGICQKVETEDNIGFRYRTTSNWNCFAERAGTYNSVHGR